MIWDGDKLHCDIKLNEQFGNETGAVSNGILLGIVDAMMLYAILADTGKVFLARKVGVDFVVPLELDKTYRATVQFLKNKGEDVYTSACIKDDSGNICATFGAVFRENKQVPIEEAVGNLDFN